MTNKEALHVIACLCLYLHVFIFLCVSVLSLYCICSSSLVFVLSLHVICMSVSSCKRICPILFCLCRSVSCLYASLYVCLGLPVFVHLCPVFVLSVHLPGFVLSLHICLSFPSPCFVLALHVCDVQYNPHMYAYEYMSSLPIAELAHNKVRLSVVNVFVPHNKLGPLYVWSTFQFTFLSVVIYSAVEIQYQPCKMTPIKTTLFFPHNY